MSIHCYSPGTISKHKSSCDAWISIHGNVYDITNFITVVSPCIDCTGSRDIDYILYN